jgi:hypothetical protein
MTHHLLDPLVTARDSDFLRVLHSVRQDGGLALGLGSEPVRPLREVEIRELLAGGNTSDGWHRIRVAEGFRTCRVRQSEFRGDVVLGRFEGTARLPGGTELPSGVFRSTVADCVIGHDALVRNVGLLAGYVLGERAAVSDCGRVVCDGPTRFGNGVALPIGPQCGGRWLRPFAEITLDLADALTSASGRGSIAARYADLLAAYLEQARSDRGVIATGATVAHAQVVRNVFVGPAAELDAVTRVEECTLLSSPDEPVRLRDGACVSETLLQWGARVTGPAAVERAVLLEHSAVERFGRITDSVIGPNTAVGGAEVTASLVGPFVGCHHQALLIAARWPAGRGNLGHGAAVGCNHTSRAPDQEAVLGEGLFIGLGAIVQYPADLSRSPYTVVASGVMLPPQKIAFPFSLVRPAAEPVSGAPPGANVLIPGWVLSENLYAVQRSRMKFAARDRATRHRPAHEVFRPEVMALVADALRQLERLGGCDVYTERDVPGLGRNVLFERHRVAAVRCYAEHLERFHLLRLLDRVSAGRATDGEWHEARHRLGRLAGLLTAYAEGVERSKVRDEERGPLVIDDYADARAPTRDDPVVRQAWDEIRRRQGQLTGVLAADGAHPEFCGAGTAVVAAPLVGGS